MRLYQTYLSPFPTRVRLLIYAKGLDVEMVRPSGFHGDGAEKGSYFDVNPIGRVPTLELDDGWTLPESEVICEYLEDAYPEPSLRPTDPKLRARMRLLSRISDIYMVRALSPLWNIVVRPPKEWDQDLDPRRARRGRPVARLLRRLHRRPGLRGRRLDHAGRRHADPDPGAGRALAADLPRARAAAAASQDRRVLAARRRRSAGGAVDRRDPRCTRGGDGPALARQEQLADRMVRLIDIECDLPTREVLEFRAAAPPPAPLGSGDTFRGRESEAPDGYGMANYAKIFRGRQQNVTEPVELGEFADWLGAHGVEKAVIGTSSVPSNTYAAEVIRARPDRFLAFACISPWDGMRGVRELERLVREHGFCGLTASTYRERLPGDDARWYPLYAKCVELGIPVRIYSAMTYANDRPYDIGHPGISTASRSTSPSS